MTKRERVIRDVLEHLRVYGDSLLNVSLAREKLSTLLPRRVLKAKPSKVARAVRKAAQREHTAKVRAEVGERSRGRCELCSAPFHEIHHVLGGADRKAKESVDTCLALCWECHRAIHRGDLAELTAALSFCQFQGMVRAEQALRRRLDKIEEART
jgi:hypothetical protein